MGFNPTAALGLENAKVRQQQAFRNPSERKFTQQELVVPRLAYQYKIVPNDMSNNGYILAVLDLYGEEKHVKISMSDEAYQAQQLKDSKSKATYEGNFNGAYIDSKMAAKIKFLENNKEEKKYVIGLESAIIKSGKVDKIDGVEYTNIVVRRIINFKSAAKALEGFFTASGYYDRQKEAYQVSSLEHWAQNPIGLNDTESLGKLVESLELINSNRQAYENGDKSADMLPNLGFRLISSKLTYGKDEKTGEQVVLSRKIFHSSDAIDLIRLEDGSYISLSEDFLFKIIEGYKNYVLNGEDSAAAQYGVKSEDVLIELVPFKVYRTSTIEPRFTLNTTNENVKKGPLYQMIQTPYFASLSEDEVPTVGKNLAYVGFVKISKNKIDEDTAKVTIQSLVTSYSFGTLRGNVLSFIRNGEDGKKYEIEERIRQRYFTEQERLEIEKRKEEKMLKEGGAGSSSLSKDSSLNAPSGLSLHSSADSNEESSNLVDSDELFNEAPQTTETKNSEATKNPDSDYGDDDDDIPF